MTAEQGGMRAKVLEEVGRSGGATKVIWQQANIPLAAGAQYHMTPTITVPGGAPMGSVYILFAADYSNSQNETSEANNLLALPITIGAMDLQASGVSVPSAGVFGQPIDVTWQVTNAGDMAVSAPWRDRVYLSTDAIFDWNDRLLGEFAVPDAQTPVAPGAVYSRTESLTLPLATTYTPGNYHVIVVTDYYNTHSELLENNNAQVSSAIDLALPTLADLVVSQITAPATGDSGGPVELTWSVTNNGTAAATGTWSDGVYLSTDQAIGGDKYLGAFHYTGTINPGETITRTQTVTLPTDAVGNAWFVVRTNVDNRVFEHTLNSNNTTLDDAAIDISLHAPNLQVTSVVAPDTASSGRQATIQYTVTNVGNAPTSAPIWYDRVYLSLDNAYQYGDLDRGYTANASYLNPGESYTSSFTFAVPDGYEGAYHVLVQADAFGNVAELMHEDDNYGASNAMTVELTPPPDLQVTSARTVGTPFSGQPLSVSWIVANEGVSQTQTGSWIDRVYLSADGELDPWQDTLLSQVSHSGVLWPDDEYGASATVTLPVGISGPWHLLIATDAGGNVFEHAYETNNIHDLPITVTLTPPPDLEVDSVTVPQAAAAGQPMTITYSVINNGSTPTTATSWIDRVYISSDGTLDTAVDTLVGSFNRTGALNVGASYTRTGSVTLPHGIQGEYIVFVVTDTGDHVFELDNDNNAGHAGPVDIALRPADLVVSAITAPATSDAGQGIYVQWTVSNDGSGVTTTNRWWDRLVLSADETVSWDDVSLGTFEHSGALSPGASYESQQLVVIPTSWDGPGHLLLVTDYYNNVVETGGEDNNLATADITVTRRQEDLAVTSVTAPTTALSGELLAISWTVQNLGQGITGVGSWIDRVYLSPDGILGGADDIMLGSYNRYGSLNPGQSYTVNQTFATDEDLQGLFKVVVVTDAGVRMPEPTMRANNTHVRDASLAVSLADVPDLQVTSITTPAALVSGQPFDVTWRVTNEGLADATGNRIDSFYLSRDPVFDAASDHYLGYFSASDALAPAGSVDLTTTLTTPAGLSGPYYLFVVADSRDHIYERSGEANNAQPSAAPMTLSVAPPADLVAGTITIPDVTTPGQNVSLTYTITNAGVNAALGGWYDALYLSADGTWDLSDPLVGRYYHTGDVAPGGSYTHTLTAPLPGVNPGLYHVILRSDIRNHIAEADEANNISASLDQADLDAEPLTLGVAVNVAIDNGLARFYRFDVADGQTLLLSLASDNADAVNRLFLAHGRVPSPTDFDFSSSSQFGASTEIVVPDTDAGTYYAMVQGEYVSGGTQNCQVLAETIPFSVRSVVVDEVGNAGPVTLKVGGARFTIDTELELVGPDGTVYPATALRLVDSSLAFATFDLTGAAVGVYDVRATDPVAGTHQFDDSVTVAVGIGPDIDARFEGPPSVRAGGLYQFNLYYGNIGDGDGVSPLIWLANSTATPMSLAPGDFTTPPGLLFLAASNEGPAGILRPGELYSIPVYYQATTETISYDAVQIFHTDDQSPIDWDFFEPALRPADMPDEQWQPLWQQVQANIGTTMGQLVAALAHDANLMPAALGSARHPGQLMQMEIARAAAQLTTSISGRCERDDVLMNIAGRKMWAINNTTDELFFTIVYNDGSFVFSDLTPGEYEFHVQDAMIVNDNPVMLADGQHLQDVVLEMTDGSYIGGIVRAQSDARRIADATVTLTSDDGYMFHAVTDESGYYFFEGLDIGTYEVTVRATGFADVTLPAIDIATLDDDITADVTLTAPAGLRGRMNYEAGGPAEPLRVTITDDVDPTVGYSVEFDTLTFELLDLPGGVYDLSLQRAGYQSVHFDDLVLATGGSLDLGTINMLLSAEISGQVVSHTPDVTPGMIDLVLISAGVELQQTVPAADGYFFFTDLPAGDYQVKVLHGENHVESTVDVTALHGEVIDDVVVGIYEGAAITGVVTDKLTSDPLAGMVVIIGSDEGRIWRTVTDSAGVYTFDQVPVGSFLVGLGVVDDASMQTVSVTDADGAIYTANFLYAYSSAGRIQGTVRNTTGGAIPYARIALYQNGHFVTAAVADELGRYEFTIFEPGTFDVLATAEQYTIASITGLAVGAGQTLTQDLSAGTGIIEGDVTGLDADETASVMLYQQVADRWTLARSATATATSTAFNFGQLAAGRTGCACSPATIAARWSR